MKINRYLVILLSLTLAACATNPGSERDPAEIDASHLLALVEFNFDSLKLL